MERVVYPQAVECKKGVLKDAGKLGGRKWDTGGPHISSKPLVLYCLYSGTHFLEGRHTPFTLENMIAR